MARCLRQGCVPRFWLILIVALTAILPARGETAEFPFEFREGLLWVKVQSSAAADRLNFLFDTGAGVTTVNLSTAKRLGMRLGRKVTVQGVHTTLSGHWQERVLLKASGVSLPDQCLAVDLSKLSSSCECAVDGLIGADFLHNRIVEIDFATSRIRLVESPDPSDVAVPLEVRPCGVRVPITVNGRPRQLVRLDTGCATALQWVTSDVPEKCTKKLAIGLSEVSIPQTTATVNLGDFHFEDLPTGLHKKPIFTGENGLLGNGLLSRFSAVTINTKAGQLLLRNRTSSD